MCRTRLMMRPIRTVLKLAAELRGSQRFIAKKCGISRPAVAEYLMRAQEAGVSWPTCEELDDAQLEMKLFPPTATESPKLPQPKWEEVYQAMQLKGATLQCLHQEYLQEYPGGMSYPWFCRLYKQFARAQRATMFLEHNPGEAAYVDYAGSTITVHPDGAGEPFNAQLFVGVLGASGLVFVEATRSQKIPDWLASHQRMLSRWGGTPRTVVCDNLKSAVTKASYRGEPEVASAYLELSNHYNFNIVPGRPYHPRDKAKAEQAVQTITRWVVFSLRHDSFSTLAELNRAIDDRVAGINNKTIRRLGKSRTQLFEETERAFLQPLPTTAWEYAEYHHLRVDLDYHVGFDNHKYSVPYNLTGAQVILRATAGVIDISHRGSHVATHARAYHPGRTTSPLHLHPRHAAYLDWSPDEALRIANSLGQACGMLLERIFAKDNHIDHQRRAFHALQNMARDYGQNRLENACARALNADTPGVTFVRNLLRNHREALAPTGTDGAEAITTHANLRSGADFTIHLIHKRSTDAD